MTMSFRRGGAAAEQAVREQQARAAGGRTSWFGLSDGESAVLRMLDDSNDWIYIAQHLHVPTRQDTAPGPHASSLPRYASAVCRADPAFTEVGAYDDCALCLRGYQPSIRVWARAIVRQQADGEWVDKIVDYPELDPDTGEPTGTWLARPEITVLNLAWGNFFTYLQDYYQVLGTVCDRDFHITRHGSDKSTDYAISACDPIEGHDLREPGLREGYELVAADREQLIVDQSSDDYYARFDTRLPWPGTRETSKPRVSVGELPPEQW